MEYYILDTETTGLDIRQHEVSEISIIRFSDKHQISRFIYLQHPERADPFALEATNRKRSELNQNLDPITHSKSNILKEINEFLLKDGLTSEHRCLIAHNASFDRRFLHALYKKTNQTLPVNFWLDTMKLIRKELKKEGQVKPKVTLQASLERYGVSALGTAHSAKYDAQNLCLLFKKLKDQETDYLEHIERHEHEI